MRCGRLAYRRARQHAPSDFNRDNGPPRGAGRLQMAMWPRAGAWREEGRKWRALGTSPRAKTRGVTPAHISLPLRKFARPVNGPQSTSNSVPTTYTWSISHCAWNALMHALHGNTTTSTAAAAASSASHEVLLAARARIGRFPPWVRHSERRGNGRTAVRSSRLPHTRYCSLRASSFRSCVWLRGVPVPCLCGASVLSTPVVFNAQPFVHNRQALKCWCPGGLDAG